MVRQSTGRELFYSNELHLQIVKCNQDIGQGRLIRQFADQCRHPSAILSNSLGDLHPFQAI